MLCAGCTQCRCQLSRCELLQLSRICVQYPSDCFLCRALLAQQVSELQAQISLLQGALEHERSALMNAQDEASTLARSRDHWRQAAESHESTLSAASASGDERAREAARARADAASAVVEAERASARCAMLEGQLQVRVCSGCGGRLCRT